LFCGKIPRYEKESIKFAEILWMKQNTDPSAVFDQQLSLAEQPPEIIVWSQPRANWCKDVSRNFF
jgi:hypothetical protein